MKRYSVVLEPGAETDLASLYDYLATTASHAVAEAYLDRLLDYIQGLELFPERGSVREIDGMTFRIIGFERRVAIAFRLDEQRVYILRILYGGRDLPDLL